MKCRTDLKSRDAAPAIIFATLLSTLWLGCAQSHRRDASCAELGGRCQSADLPCDADEEFLGGELCAENPSSCCGPRADARAGARCSNDADCPAELVCIDLGDARICAAYCSAGATRCPGELVCHVPGDASGFCVPSCGADPSSCPAGLACAGAHCWPERCARAAAPACCFDDAHCSAGDRCYGADCEGVTGRCLTVPPYGECWVDADCDHGRCEGAVVDTSRCVLAVVGEATGRCVWE